MIGSFFIEVGIYMKMQNLFLSLLLSMPLLQCGWPFSWSGAKPAETNSETLQCPVESIAEAAAAVPVQEDCLMLVPSKQKLKADIVARLQRKTFISERRQLERDLLARKEKQCGLEEKQVNHFFIPAGNAVSRDLSATAIQRLMVKSVKGNDPYRKYKPSEAFYIPWSKEAKGDVPAAFLERMQERNKKITLKARAFKKDSSTVSVQVDPVEMLEAENAHLQDRLLQHKEFLSGLLDVLSQHPDACDKDGNTALHYAVYHGWRSVAAALKRHGADATRCNHALQTPRDLAEQQADPVMKAIMVSRGR